MFLTKKSGLIVAFIPYIIYRKPAGLLPSRGRRGCALAVLGAQLPGTGKSNDNRAKDDGMEARLYARMSVGYRLAFCLWNVGY